MVQDAKIQKRADIIKAASLIFSEKGYPNTRMQEIATEAGMGKGTIYQYFKGKKHLFQQVIRAGVTIYIDGIKNEIKHSDDLEDLLGRIATFSFCFAQKHSEVIKMLVPHQSLVDDHMLEWIFDKTHKAIDLIARAICKSAGKMGADDFERAEFATHCFMGMTAVMAKEKFFHKKDFDVPDAVDHLVGLFLHGYLSEAEMHNY